MRRGEEGQGTDAQQVMVRELFASLAVARHAIEELDEWRRGLDGPCAALDERAFKVLLRAIKQ